MIKNIFEVNNEEKSRILNLHENATKRQYLSEDTEEVNSFSLFPPTKEEIDKGQEIINKLLKSDNLQAKYWLPKVTDKYVKNVSGQQETNPYENWAKWSGMPRSIQRTFGQIYKETVRNNTALDNRIIGKIGRYFLKNPNELTKVDDIISKTPEQMMEILHSNTR